MNFPNIIADEQELRDLIGHPGLLVQNKTIDHLDQHCRDFLAMSPLLLLSTADETGACDVSPRGDQPGFVKVLDEKRLLIPERPGNRRADTLLNLLTNPQVGMLFLIPGLEETLRINGRACIVRDQELLEQMAAHEKVPLLAIGVEVEECFMHCAKAFKRSKLWQPDAWPAPSALPSPARIIADHVKLPDIGEAEVKKSLHESYTQRLY